MAARRTRRPTRCALEVSPLPLSDEAVAQTPEMAFHFEVGVISASKAFKRVVATDSTPTFRVHHLCATASVRSGSSDPSEPEDDQEDPDDRGDDQPDPDRSVVHACAKALGIAAASGNTSLNPFDMPAVLERPHHEQHTGDHLGCIHRID